MATRKNSSKKSPSVRSTTRRIQRSTRSNNRPAVVTRRQASAVPTVGLPTSTWPALVSVLAAAILAFGLYLVFRTPTVIAPTETTEQQQVSYQGVEGRTALELLKTKAVVETKAYEGLGELVTSINGVPSTSEHFWIFYINDEQAQVGASSYVTKSTDEISWRFEAAQ